MSIQNAIDFLQKTMQNPESRSELYGLNSQSEFADWLSLRGMPFHMGEFEESVNLLHVKCQSHEEANLLLNRVDWVRMYWSSLTET
jgi:hypothetical protein